MNYELLRNVQALYNQKRAYVPPPPPQTQGGANQAQQQPSQPNQGPPVNPDQVMQMVQQGIQQGVPANEIIGTLQSQGVPQELLGQIIDQLSNGSPSAPADSPSEPPSAPPIDVRSIMDSKVEEERKKLKEMRLSPEDRIFILEKKIDTLTDIVQELVGGMPPKEGSDKAYLDTLLSSMNKE